MDTTLLFEDMRAEHLAGAMRLSKQANWPHRIEDWALVHHISKGVVALVDGQVVATALATPYASAAMANLIIVDKALRGRGLGRKIMQRAMALLDPPCWHLVATQDGLPLYENLGFQAVGTIEQYQGILAQIPPKGAALWGTRQDMSVIKSLDSAATGMDRSAFFEALPQDARLAILPDHSGFGIARRFGRGHLIGPICAPDLDGAQSLVSLLASEHGGQFVRLDTDAGTGLGPWLATLGAAKVDEGITMQKGAAMPATGPQQVFALAAQALG